jgi:hypothetical protein
MRLKLIPLFFLGLGLLMDFMLIYGKHEIESTILYSFCKIS